MFKNSEISLYPSSLKAESTVHSQSPFLCESYGITYVVHCLCITLVFRVKSSFFEMNQPTASFFWLLFGIYWAGVGQEYTVLIIAGFLIITTH